MYIDIILQALVSLFVLILKLWVSTRINVRTSIVNSTIKFLVWILAIVVVCLLVLGMIST